MPTSTSRLAFPKPESRRKAKARDDRAEAAVKKSVRAFVAERDGYCRLWLYEVETGCDGPSEWAHLTRRSHTRGMAPTARHNSLITAMLCRTHHRQFDACLVGLRMLTDFGADGLMMLTEAGEDVREV